ncbi:MAG TPA: hypothetical protein VGK90_11750 [Rhizomicrobium sp.]|jgi:LPS sulfotransferase NodH
MSGASEADQESRALWAEEVGSPAPKVDGIWNYIITADDAEREQALLNDFPASGGIKVHGLFNEVLPAVLCGAGGLAREYPDGNLKRYAVLCVPRSGSRYLVSVLNRHGLGMPEEHLREPLGAAIADGRLPFRKSFKELERFGQRNGVFGTKLISSFLIRACNGRLQRIEQNIGWMAQRGFQFVYLDRPLNESVISNYIAARIKKWHFFEQLDDTTKDILDKLEFNEDAAWSEYIRFRAQKLTLAYLAQTFHMPAISYTSLQESVESVVSALGTRLNVDPAALKGGSAAVPVPTRKESDTYANFSGALSDVLETRKHEITPYTEKMLRELVGVDKETAEHLAATPIP